MHRKTYFVLLLVIFFSSCYEPKRNCTDFKTGTFAFETFLNGEVKQTTFVRNDTLEIDYFNEKADSSAIRWINDCEYIAEKINPKNRQEEKAIHFKIISTTTDTYTFEYNLVGKTKKQKGTVQKVN
ncbi:MAG: DNA topoisomerase IV [Leeuwenhoekiella sp.]